MPDAIPVTFTVNGETLAETVEARKSLVDFLREHLSLTGSHVGCEHGVCGACTVRVDGVIVRSVSTPAVIRFSLRSWLDSGLAPLLGQPAWSPPRSLRSSLAGARCDAHSLSAPGISLRCSLRRRSHDTPCCASHPSARM